MIFEDHRQSHVDGIRRTIDNAGRERSQEVTRGSKLRDASEAELDRGGRWPRAPRPKRSLELNQRLSALFKRNLFVRVLVTRNLSESDCTEPLEKRGENVTVTKHGVPKPAGRRVASLKIDMEVIVRHFWLAFVVVTIVNGRYWWAGVQGRIRAQPELGPGYHRLYRGYLFWCNVPWLLMGVGILSGQVRWMFDFLQPRSGNAYVLAWWWTMATLLALGTVWMFWGGGATTLAKHPGIAFVPQWPAPKLRWFWLGLVVWNVAIGALIWNSTPGRVVPPSLPAEWAQVLFPLLFVVLWCFVSVLLAWIGGWGVLARHYPARRGFDGRRFSFRSARLGGVSYSGCLTLTVGAEGVSVAVLPMFRAGHPPLFIPWGDVTASAGRTWIFRWVELGFAQCPGPTFRISRRLAEALTRESNGRLRLPSLA